MKIEILGTGCSKCKKLEENVKTALKEGNIQAEVFKITDIEKIMEFGIMMTPALAIDGKVVSAGRLISKEEIIKLMDLYK